MTRKDYKIIADAIRKSGDYFAETYKNDDMRDTMINLGIGRIVCELQVALKEENPNFNTTIFRKACGL